MILDSDPSHRFLREPLIKIIALMRNLNYRQNDADFDQKMIRLQLPPFGLKFPTQRNFCIVVSFFRGHCHYPHAIGTINGTISLIKLGLSSHYDGFGGGFCNQKELEDTSNLNTKGRLASTNDV